MPWLRANWMRLCVAVWMLAVLALLFSVELRIRSCVRWYKVGWGVVAVTGTVDVEGTIKVKEPVEVTTPDGKALPVEGPYGYPVHVRVVR